MPVNAGKRHFCLLGVLSMPVFTGGKYRKCHRPALDWGTNISTRVMTKGVVTYINV